MKDVARHTYLARRKGSANWQFRARVPLDLVEQFGRREVTKSLGTADLAEAKRRVRDEADAFDRQCRAVRERVASNDGDTVGSVALTSLSEAAIEQMALAWFTTLAADGDRRHQMAVPLDRDEALAALDQEEGALCASNDLGLDACYQTAIGLLRANDVRLLKRRLNPIRAAASPMAFVVAREDAASAQFRQLLALLRRSRLEDVHRSRARLSGDFQDEAFDPVFRLRLEPKGKSLAEVIAAFQSEPERAQKNTKLQQTYATVFRLAGEMFGADRPISEIGREECKAFRNMVQALPPNASKRFPGRALVEVTKLATPKSDRLRPATVNHYIDALATLFNYAESEGWVKQNPAKRLALKGVKKRHRRDPFTSADLNKIFQAPLYLGCQDDEGGYAKPGPNRPRRGRFWIPLISLFSGMRQGEVAQLRIEDVRLFQGVMCIFIQADGEDVEEADRRRVKTEAGERFVPVHPALVQIGLIAHVDWMRRAGADRLFPDIVRGSDGYFSPFSKWFSRFLKEAGVKRDRNAFHSFRHSFRDAMREAAVPLDAVIALGGWEGGGTQADYGTAQISATRLRTYMDSIRYEGLDLAHLIAR